ncbi:uncharacterized protein LOC9634955 isoform X2 [Selaginella moellendorffii]|uniref:uncharacterized protein LOC9634955 isoform X2 n=1 Tax=Selaginella moellendorffii TaxID=88036 RepID=UPI000D1C2EB4|nr:uncharacterized protein LOC9634955 isoform X2 [Selaginella moellendorffii]|eukprot:XP_024525953.1 uncharacterized protein LOC9634955 isoform X2 [Selaginella moellendorffii]
MEKDRGILIAILVVLPLLLQAAKISLSPPDGNSIDFEVTASGFQIYSCVDVNKTGHLSWALDRAEAELFDAKFHTLIGFHYFLPKPDAGGGRATWSLLKTPGSSSSELPSSTVTGIKLSKLSLHCYSSQTLTLFLLFVIDRPGKTITNLSGGRGNIDDLLVQATSHSGHTRLGRASYIQRIKTRGGTAPSDEICKVGGMTQAVPYKSDYVFWTQQASDVIEGHHGYIDAKYSTRPLFLLFGEGFQHYRFDGSAWQLFNASALLSSIPGQEVIGDHYFLETKDARGGQPTWSSFASPSTVTAKPVNTLRPATSDSISWADLHATGNTGDKYFFGGVTYVQRRSTRGGLPPQVSRAPKVGDVFLSPYSAVYWFYVSS